MPAPKKKQPTTSDDPSAHLEEEKATLPKSKKGRKPNTAKRPSNSDSDDSDDFDESDLYGLISEPNASTKPSSRAVGKVATKVRKTNDGTHDVKEEQKQQQPTSRSSGSRAARNKSKPIAAVSDVMHNDMCSILLMMGAKVTVKTLSDQKRNHQRPSPNLNQFSLTVMMTLKLQILRRNQNNRRKKHPKTKKLKRHSRRRRLLPPRNQRSGQRTVSQRSNLAKMLNLRKESNKSQARPREVKTTVVNPCLPKKSPKLPSKST